MKNNNNESSKKKWLASFLQEKLNVGAGMMCLPHSPIWYDMMMTDPCLDNQQICLPKSGKYL